MAGSMTIPNSFQNQAGNVPASEIDDNFTAVRTYVNAREVAVGLIAARPAAGTPGRWFLATDVAGGTLYVDNGVTWDTAGAGANVTGGAGGVNLWLTPMNATFPNADFAALVKNQGTQTYDYTLDFNSQVLQSARWEFQVPSNFTVSSASIAVLSRMNTAITGTVGWIVTERAAAPGGSWDVAGTSVTLTATDVGATTGTLLSQSTALLITGWAPEVLLQLQISRNVAGDTAASDAKFIGAVVRII